MPIRAHKISFVGGLIFIGLTLVTGVSVYLVMLQQPERIYKLHSLAQNKINDKRYN